MDSKSYDVKVFADDKKMWYFNGELHREDGPAIEWCGTKLWFFNGKRHRTDGPAVESAAGVKEWWVNGKFIRSNQKI